MLKGWWLGAVLVLGLASAAEAQRATPPLEGPGPFSEAVVEDGAVGPWQFVRLATDARADDLLVYNRRSGSALLVINHGIYGGQTHYHPLAWTFQIEVFCWVRWEPGLTLIALHQDDDAFEDVLGYQAETGTVHRYYRRGGRSTCP